MGPLSVSDIATHTSCRLPTITKTVYKMKDTGLVDINPHDKDGRILVVNLTTKGIETIEGVIEDTKSIFNKAYVGLTTEQLESLNTMLETIVKNLAND